MHSLKTVLASLREEIEAALAGSETPSRAIHLEPDRVVVSLQVQLGPADQDPARATDGPPLILVQSHDRPVKSGPPTTGPLPGHTLTIEFKIGGPGSPPTAAGGAAATLLQRSGPSTVAEQLTELFGPPGFDSSARAMVFREMLDDLSDEDLTALRLVLDGEPVANFSDTVRRARHLLLGLIRSGPLKDTERGSALLSRLFAQESRESLVGLVRERWKTQNDWLSP